MSNTVSVSDYIHALIDCFHEDEEIQLFLKYLAANTQKYKYPLPQIQETIFTVLTSRLKRNNRYINALQASGKTLLYLAVEYDHDKLANWLLRHHADPNTSFQGGSILWRAINNHNVGLSIRLKRYGAKLQQNEVMATIQQHMSPEVEAIQTR